MIIDYFVVGLELDVLCGCVLVMFGELFGWSFGVVWCLGEDGVMLGCVLVWYVFGVCGLIGVFVVEMLLLSFVFG